MSGEPFGANHSYALQWEQCLYRECSSDPDDQQGLTIFGAFYPRFAAEPKLEGSIGHNFAAGATYVGLVPCRDRDMLGAGVVWAQLFQGGENRELVIECFYKAEWTPRFRIQPDVQYVISPSGIHRDALAIGTRFEVLW